MIYKMLIVARNTFTETLRQPIYAVIITFALFSFIIAPSVSMYTLDEDVKLLRELGLSTLFLAGLFIAVFSATGAITEEIDTKTIATVLSKPISRPTFILGKFFGVVSAVALAHYICTLALLFAVRHGVLESASDTHDWTVITAGAAVLAGAILIAAFLNYTYDWNFPSTATVLIAAFATIAIIALAFIDRDWHFNPHDNGFTAFDICASILLLMAIIVLVALAVMFSTRLNVILTLTCTVALFLLGLISDYTFGRLADTHLWAKIGQTLTPNFQLFWISDAIYEGSAVGIEYLLITAGYSALYTVAILALAVAGFQRRQIG